MSTVFPTSVRLPMRLRALLRKEARKQGRSFVKHVEWILTKHLEEQGIIVDEAAAKLARKAGTYKDE